MLVVTTSDADGTPANGDIIKVLVLFEGDQGRWLGKVGLFEYNDGRIDLEDAVEILTSSPVEDAEVRSIFDRAKADWRLVHLQSTTVPEFAEKC